MYPGGTDCIYNNKGKTIFTILENKTSIQQINHKFLVPGHTHIECDSDHLLIEKQKKHSIVHFVTERGPRAVGTWVDV